ncbi:methyltransferase-like protein 23 [Asterias rubens]|uniref:methyltransferase-like protein 23 n=1 Tax=Asterias rubens TaxID=7604 RepID=UPI0014557949|nr:methyltransferase-like protein 23 [Asterias rubens]
MQFDETPSSQSVESLKVFTFKDEEETEGEVEVKIPEVVDPAYGMYVWPSAPVLAQYIWKKRKWIFGKRVLELGAGTALPGILAAICGAVVTLSDHSRYPRCLENCLKSCQANDLRDSVDIVGLSWGEFPPGIFQLPTFDVILASDCFYDTKDFENVLATIVFFLEKGTTTRCWISYQERSSDRSLDQLLIRWGLHCLHIPLGVFGADGPSVAGSNLPGHHSIQLLELTQL